MRDRRKNTEALKRKRKCVRCEDEVKLKNVWSIYRELILT